MRRLCVLLAMASLGVPAQAAEGVELSLKSRSQAAEASATTKLADAPFRAARHRLPQMPLREELESRGPRASCETATADLCYDLAGGRLVYRRAREFMPRIDGLRAESISVKRDRVILKYSF